MADKARLHRSEFAVRGTNLRAIEKAPTLRADLAFLDLEDAVAPDDKEAGPRERDRGPASPGASRHGRPGPFGRWRPRSGKRACRA